MKSESGLDNAAWRKSTHSGPEGGSCVEITLVDSEIGVRDSKDLFAGHLDITALAWSTLIADIRASS